VTLISADIRQEQAGFATFAKPVIVAHVVSRNSIHQTFPARRRERFKSVGVARLLESFVEQIGDSLPGPRVGAFAVCKVWDASAVGLRCGKAVAGF